MLSKQFLLRNKLSKNRWILATERWVTPLSRHFEELYQSQETESNGIRSRTTRLEDKWASKWTFALQKGVVQLLIMASPVRWLKSVAAKGYCVPLRTSSIKKNICIL